MGMPRDGKYTCHTTMTRDDFFFLYSGQASPATVASMCLTGRIKVKWFRYHELQQFAGAFTYSSPNWIMFYRLKEKEELYRLMLKQQWERGHAAGQLVDRNGFMHAPEALDEDTRSQLEADRLEFLGIPLSGSAVATVEEAPVAADVVVASSEREAVVTAEEPALDTAASAAESAIAAAEDASSPPLEATATDAAVAEALPSSGLASEPDTAIASASLEPALEREDVAVGVAAAPAVPDAGILEAPASVDALPEPATQVEAAIVAEPTAEQPEQLQHSSPPSPLEAEAQSLEAAAAAVAATGAVVAAATAAGTVADIANANGEQQGTTDAPDASRVAEPIAATEVDAASAIPVLVASIHAPATSAAEVVTAADDAAQLPASPDASPILFTLPRSPSSLASLQSVTDPSNLDLDMLLLLPELLQTTPPSVQQLSSSTKFRVLNVPDPIHCSSAGSSTDTLLDATVTTESTSNFHFTTVEDAVSPMIQAIRGHIVEGKDAHARYRAAAAEKQSIVSPPPADGVLDSITSAFSSVGRTVTSWFSNEQELKVQALTLAAEQASSQARELERQASSALQAVTGEIDATTRCAVAGSVLAACVAPTQHQSTLTASLRQTGWLESAGHHASSLSPLLDLPYCRPIITLQDSSAAVAAQRGRGLPILNSIRSVASHAADSMTSLPGLHAGLGYLHAPAVAAAFAALYPFLLPSTPSPSTPLARPSRHSYAHVDDGIIGSDLRPQLAELLRDVQLMRTDTDNDASSPSSSSQKIQTQHAKAGQRRGSADSNNSTGGKAKLAGGIGNGSSNSSGSILDSLSLPQIELPDVATAALSFNVLESAHSEGASGSAGGGAPGGYSGPPPIPSLVHVTTLSSTNSSVTPSQSQDGDAASAVASAFEHAAPDAAEAEADIDTVIAKAANAFRVAFGRHASLSQPLLDLAAGINGKPSSGSAAPAQYLQLQAGLARLPMCVLPSFWPPISSTSIDDSSAAVSSVHGAVRSALTLSSRAVSIWRSLLSQARHSTVVDPQQAETMLWCLGKSTAAGVFTRVPLSLGAVEVPATSSISSSHCGGGDNDTEPEHQHADASPALSLLPIWRPKRLASYHAFKHHDAAVPSSGAAGGVGDLREQSPLQPAKVPSSPVVYNGLGSGLYLQTATARLRMKLEGAVSKAAHDTAGHDGDGSGLASSSSTAAAPNVVDVGIGPRRSPLHLRVLLRRGTSPEDHDTFLWGNGDDTLQAAAPPVSRLTERVIPSAALVDVAKSLRDQGLWKHYARAGPLDVYTANSKGFRKP